MTLIGNIFLLFATVVFLALTSAVYKAPPGGDAAVSYFWNIILLTVVFVVCMIIATLIIGFKGGYDWVSKDKTTRFFLVSGGLLLAIITMGLCSLFKYEHGRIPWLIRFFAVFVPFVIPFVLVVSNFFLLNNTVRDLVPAPVYIWPLILVACLGIAGTAAGLYEWAVSSARNQQAKVNSIIEDQNRNHDRMLAEIDSCDVMINMVFILVFADANQDTAVRAKAVAKIKTNPQWQQELIKRLESDWAPEAFNFLASNDVDDAALFPAAVKEGIIRQAKLIRETIRRSSHSSHFYGQQFSWETERVLRTADRFNNMGVDFLAAVKELRASLDEPSEYKKIKFDCIRAIDEWIEKHRH